MNDFEADWTTSHVYCVFCGRDWQAVHTLDTKVLECPECHKIGPITEIPKSGGDNEKTL